MRFILVLLVVGAAIPCFAQTPLHRKAVLAVSLSHKMISEEDTKKISNQIISSVLNTSGEMPQEQRAVVAHLLRKIYPPRLMIKVRALLYYQHFTESELEELNRFYDSPVGKKEAKLAPLMFQEASAIYMRIGQNALKEIAEKSPVQGAVVKQAERKRVHIETFAKNDRY